MLRILKKDKLLASIMNENKNWRKVKVTNRMNLQNKFYSKK